MVDVMMASDLSVEEDNFNPLLVKRSRLGNCEVCGDHVAIYTCPACQVKTCSLPCITIHKKELECTGIRNKVKFKRLDKFTDMDLQSDYSLLEEIGRSVERVGKGRKIFQKNMAFKWVKMKNHVWRKGTRLDFLPPTFSKHINNTSYLNWNTGVVYWKVDWVFPHSSQLPEHSACLSVVDNRVDETCLVVDQLEKHLPSDSTLLNPALAERLKPYYDSGAINPVKILSKVEKSGGKSKYLLINPNLSLSENLEGKTIIEHPTFYVVLSSHIQDYDVVSPESVKVISNERRNNYKKRPYHRGCNSGSMKFFSDNLSDSDGN